MTKNKFRAFTLLEVLLTIAIVVLILGVSLPVYQLSTVRADLETASSAIALTARRAQSLAQGVSGDSNWGIKVQTGNLTLYKGSDFASRDQAMDELTSLPPEVAVSGIDDINFTKLTGTTANTGSINLSTQIENKSITINERGAIFY